LLKETCGQSVMRAQSESHEYLSIYMLVNFFKLSKKLSRI